MDLDRIIDRWRGPLVGLLGARGASPADAVELAQDAFSEAYLGRERFDGSGRTTARSAPAAGTPGPLRRGGAAGDPVACGGRDALDQEADARPEAEAGPVLAAVERLRVVAGGPDDALWRGGLAKIGALLGSGSGPSGRLRRAGRSSGGSWSRTGP